MQNQNSVNYEEHYPTVAQDDEEKHPTIPAPINIENSRSTNRLLRDQHDPAIACQPRALSSKLTASPFHITLIVKSNGDFDIQTNLPYTDKLSAEDSDTWLIGRSPNCAIVLSDRMVSRYHALIGYDKHCGFYITDLRSQNGSFLNQKRLSPLEQYSLNDGDIMVLPQVFVQINIHYSRYTLRP